jgi:hypothetical protein
MHSILPDIAGLQILPEHKGADARVYEHAALYRGLVDSASTKMPEMLDLRYVRTGV